MTSRARKAARATPRSPVAREAVAAPSLAELQATFQKALIEGDDEILANIYDNSRTDRATLFGVYRNAYIVRLVEVIGSEHPRLLSYLGDETFGQVAREYIAAHPSRFRSARWVATRFPEFLAGLPLVEGHPEIVELAQLERATSNAFDATDDRAAGLDDLAGVPPDQWSDLVFRPRASAIRLDFTTNAFAIWSALGAEAEPPALELRSEPERLLVWRPDVTPKVRVIGVEEAMLWDEAVRSVPFGRLCELAAVFDDPEGAPLRVAGYLQVWLSGQALSSAAVPGATAAADLR